MPRNLKLPDGCSSSFLKNIRHGGLSNWFVTSTKDVLMEGKFIVKIREVNNGNGKIYATIK